LFFKSSFLLVLLICPFPALAQQQTTQIPPANSTIVVLGTFDPVTQGQSSRSVVVMDPEEHPLAFQDVEDYLRTDSSVDIQERERYVKPILFKSVPGFNVVA